jgi:hypothetical protein
MQTNLYVIIFDDLCRALVRDTKFHLMLREEFAKRGALVECLNYKLKTLRRDFRRNRLCCTRSAERQ